MFFCHRNLTPEEIKQIQFVWTYSLDETQVEIGFDNPLNPKERFNFLDVETAKADTKTLVDTMKKVDSDLIETTYFVAYTKRIASSDVKISYPDNINDPNVEDCFILFINQNTVPVFYTKHLAKYKTILIDEVIQVTSDSDESKKAQFVASQITDENGKPLIAPEFFKTMPIKTGKQIETEVGEVKIIRNNDLRNKDLKIVLDKLRNYNSK